MNKPQPTKGDDVAMTDGYPETKLTRPETSGEGVGATFSELDAELTATKSALDSLLKVVEGLEKWLQFHHKHQLESCKVFFEQDGKPIDIVTDLGEAYCDSPYCEPTLEALDALIQWRREHGREKV